MLILPLIASVFMAVGTYTPPDRGQPDGTIGSGTRASCPIIEKGGNRRKACE